MVHELFNVLVLCVCVCEREREKERDDFNNVTKNLFTVSFECGG